MMKNARILLILLWIGVGCKGPLTVDKVLTGDTFILNTGQKVRYACLEAPKQSQPLYGESIDANKYLVEGKKVELVMEQSLPGDEEDIHRAYVYTPVLIDKDNVKYLFVNAELVLFGYATVVVPPKVEHEDMLTNLRDLEERAKAQRQGIWGR